MKRISVAISGSARKRSLASKANPALVKAIKDFEEIVKNLRAAIKEAEENTMDLPEKDQKKEIDRITKIAEKIESLSDDLIDP